MIAVVHTSLEPTKQRTNDGTKDQTKEQHLHKRIGFMQTSTPWPALQVGLHSCLLLPEQRLLQLASDAAAPLHPMQPFQPPACTPLNFG